MKIAGVHDKATAFEGAAGVYEHSRPGYPAEAVSFLTRTLALGPGQWVVDLAAGTGKLTRDLVSTGAKVIAAEPVAAMRQTLAATAIATTVAATEAGPRGTPPLSVVAAIAQALPVGDGLLDAITVAQGFHWFDTAEAVGEMHRAIRPGGGLGLIWNHRDNSDPLQQALTDFMEPWRGDTPSYDSGRWRQALVPGRLFGAAQEFRFPWRQPVDVEGVADRVASVSFIADLPDEHRARLLGDVKAVASEIGPPLSLAYVAEVFVFSRLA